MASPDVIYTCPDCCQWFSGNEKAVIDVTTCEEYTENIRNCPDCRIPLDDADECNLQTPYQAQEADKLLLKASHLEDQLEHIKIELTSLGDHTYED